MKQFKLFGKLQKPPIGDLPSVKTFTQPISNARYIIIVIGFFYFISGYYILTLLFIVISILSAFKKFIDNLLLCRIIMKHFIQVFI
jgi:hypothetical protein